MVNASIINYGKILGINHKKPKNGTFFLDKKKLKLNNQTKIIFC